MLIKKKQLKLNDHNENIIESIVNALKKADKIVIGAGSGLSASAGLDYSNKEIFEKFYTPFLKRGFKTIGEAIANYWYLTEENATSYWGFWATHINTIYYSHKQLETYKMLYNIIKGKDYFVVTTNVDDQFYRGGFDSEKVFAMQGSYGEFQCQHGCHHIVYSNEQMVKTMLTGFDSNTLKIKKEDVPRCSKCGGLLSPHLRIDQFFVEPITKSRKEDYVKFINHLEEKIIFLELGVGYNTPVIIRYPFEEMTKAFNNATLVRVNKGCSKVPDSIVDRSIATDIDIHDLLDHISKSD